MRIGYGAFPKGIIEYMWRAKQPYNVSVAAEVAACAALSNPEYLKVYYANFAAWILSMSRQPFTDDLIYCLRK